MNYVAHGAVRSIEACNDFRGFKFGPIPNCPELLPFRINAKNSPFIVARAHIDLRKSIRWNPARMLDQIAVHVDYPQGAVRSRPRLDWPEPIVGGCKEF